MPNRFPALLFNSWLGLHFLVAEKVVAVSESVLRILPSNDKLILIHNELPIEERHAKTALAKDKPFYIFLYLANFMKGKGQDYALEAFAIVSSRLSNWRLRFVGGTMGLKKNSEYRDSLLEKAKALGIHEKTEWIGFTEDVEREYKEADVVLNFSESESFSITCVEAQFFGRPIIVTDCGGPAEIVVTGETGLLIPNKDVGAMKQAMEKLALDYNLRQEMGLKAREVVRRKFSIDKTSLRLKEVYSNIISR
jgi:glycosyltransferase involved in cell wall biosynthesis